MIANILILDKASNFNNNTPSKLNKNTGRLMGEVVTFTSEDARRLTRDAEKRIIEEKTNIVEKERIRAEKYRISLKTEVERYWLIKAREEIKKSCNEGRDSAAICLYSWQRELTDLHRYVAQALQQKLVDDHFNVEVKTVKEEPVGSDPQLPYTTYSLYCVISWSE